MTKKVGIIGAGAAGLMAANLLIDQGDNLEVFLFEKGKPLEKVRYSGGGRCNFTHQMSSLREFVKSYPRGEKELYSVFSRFGPGDLIAWFQTQGVESKEEKDGRIFPCTNRSDTIIEVLSKVLESERLHFFPGTRVVSLKHQEGRWIVKTESKECFTVDALLVATGGASNPLVKPLGHTFIPFIPSLFSFKISSFPLHPYSGLTLPYVKLSFPEWKCMTLGSLLITHHGFSGPAALNLSALAAKELDASHYQGILEIDWLTDLKEDDFQGQPILPRRLMAHFLKPYRLPLSSRDQHALWATLKKDRYQVIGKKGGMVSVGGISRQEIEFKRMESRLIPGLFFAGEVVDIDGITGGYNLQAAFSMGAIAARAILKSSQSSN